MGVHVLQSVVDHAKIWYHILSVYEAFQDEIMVMFTF